MPRIIDVVDHVNVAEDELIYREPQQGSGDFRMGSQVIVSESQVAVFVRSGQVLDSLGPGRHTLSTANLPILAGLIGLATSGRTPFTADLYFVNLRDLPQVGWGTNPPIVLETPGRGMGVVLLITHGVLDIGIEDPVRFVRQYGFNKPITTLRDIRDRLQSTILGEVTQLLMTANVQSVPDANRALNDLEAAMMVRLKDKFDALGMRIKAFEANPFLAKENVSLEELRNYVALETYERIQRLNIAQKAAENQGLGGALVGAGVGLGVGQQMGATMNPDMANLQRQLQEQQLMMNQMMMNNMAQRPQNAPETPASPAPAAATPQTAADVHAMLDALDARLVAGEVSEALYNTLVTKYQARLKELGS